MEALYDPAAAHEAALRNLLQRRGFRDLDAVLEKGLETGELALVLHLLQRVVGQLPESTLQRIRQLDRDGLATLAVELLDFRTVGDLTAWLEHHG
ncbi:DUF4351 domain-containing protein [Herbaspirillum sp.]|uniref:DUF4351 domain-containing protein n=1 Tax=Herbaspirillum sp. TaxID=1890675 RepID=UPI00338EC6D2